jgi:hypothetical protein
MNICAMVLVELLEQGRGLDGQSNLYLLLDYHRSIREVAQLRLCKWSVRCKLRISLGRQGHTS